MLHFRIHVGFRSIPWIFHSEVRGSQGQLFSWWTATAQESQNLLYLLRSSHTQTLCTVSSSYTPLANQVLWQNPHGQCERSSKG